MAVKGIGTPACPPGEPPAVVADAGWELEVDAWPPLLAAAADGPAFGVASGSAGVATGKAGGATTGVDTGGRLGVGSGRGGSGNHSREAISKATHQGPNAI